MPDLATHSLLSYLLSGKTTERKALLLFLTGSILPDAIRVPAVLAGPLLGDLGLRTPAWLEVGFFLFHSPIPYFLLCWAIAWLFPPADRWTACSRLALGGWLHIALDLLQHHIGPGAYFPLYPFGRHSWELGLIGTEDSLFAVPWLAAAALIVWWIRHYRSAEEGAASSSR